MVMISLECTRVVVPGEQSVRKDPDSHAVELFACSRAFPTMTQKRFLHFDFWQPTTICHIFLSRRIPDNKL